MSQQLEMMTEVLKRKVNTLMNYLHNVVQRQTKIVFINVIIIIIDRTIQTITRSCLF